MSEERIIRGLCYLTHKYRTNSLSRNDTPAVRYTFQGFRLKQPTYESRVLRGGSWGNLPRFLRSADRLSYSPSYCNYYFGLRLVQRGTA